MKTCTPFALLAVLFIILAIGLNNAGTTAQSSSSTASAPSSTTPAPSSATPAPSSATPAPSSTTPAPSNTTQALSRTTSKPSISYCQASPCEDGAACIELLTKRVCLCGEGYYYKDSLCQRGKTFPGDIVVQVSETTDLDNKYSRAYEELHDKVITFFQKAFVHSDYGQTVILRVSFSASLSGRSEMRADNKPVHASIVNIFKLSTSLSEDNVTSMIEQALKSNSSNILNYAALDLCELYGCVKTDGDLCSNGLQCECKPGLQRPNVNSPYCLPLECPKNCSAEFHKQCLKKEDSDVPQCECLPGYQKDANDICQECPFGYGGVDCKDQFQLILTIVGTIAAILILGLLISLIFLARSKNKTNNIEEQNLIDNDFQNLQLQSTGFSNIGADGTIFPKVKTLTSKDGQMQNPYAKQSSVPRPDY